MSVPLQALDQAFHKDDVVKQLEDLYNAERESGFSSLKSSLPVARRLADVSRAADADPCAADILANGLARPFGFGSRALVLSDELELAVYSNKSVAICEGSQEDPGIEWSRFFQNPAGLVMCADAAICSSRRDNKLINLASKMTKDLREQHHGFQSRMKLQLYKALFTYKPETLAHTDKALAASGLVPGMRYVGVHVRRGDKRLLSMLPIDEYASLVAEALRSHQLNVVYVASDDPKSAGELRSKLGPEFPKLQILQAYSPSSATRDYGNSGDDEAMLVLLADLRALQQSAVFVGSHTSSFARMASFMRGMDPSVSIDGDFLREEGIISGYGFNDE